MTARADPSAIARALGGVFSNGLILAPGPAMNRDFCVHTLPNGEQVEALRCEDSRHRRPIGRGAWPMNAPDRQPHDGADACQAKIDIARYTKWSKNFGEVVSARRAIPRAAQTAAEVADQLRLGMVAECADRGAAYAQRAANAARRRDKRPSPSGFARCGWRRRHRRVRGARREGDDLARTRSDLGPTEKEGKNAQ